MHHHQSKIGACYACTEHGMTSTHSHLWHKAKGGGKVGRPTHEGGHHHMYCDPPLMALLLVGLLFELWRKAGQLIMLWCTQHSHLLAMHSRR